MKGKRKGEIIAMRQEGLTYAQIAKEFGISRQRVHQIINNKIIPKFVKLTNTQKALIYLAEMMQDPMHDQYMIKARVFEILELVQLNNK